MLLSEGMLGSVSTPQPSSHPNAFQARATCISQHMHARARNPDEVRGLSLRPFRSKALERLHHVIGLKERAGNLTCCSALLGTACSYECCRACHGTDRVCVTTDVQHPLKPVHTSFGAGSTPNRHDSLQGSKDSKRLQLSVLLHLRALGLPFC